MRDHLGGGKCSIGIRTFRKNYVRRFLCEGPSSWWDRGWRPRPRNILQTLKYVLDARAISRLGHPATSQYFPYRIREPPPLRSFRPLRAVAPKYLSGNNLVAVSVKRDLLNEDFVYHHPESITIRIHRLTVVFDFWIEEFGTHPSGGAAMCERVQRCRVGYDRDKTKIREAGAASLVDQDIELKDDYRQRENVDIIF